MDISGVLIIDKSAGITSRKVCDRVSEITGVKKVGHAGTLDPMAVGVLIVLLGEATKIDPYLKNLEKEYVTSIVFGKKRDTGDKDGKIIEKDEEFNIIEKKVLEKVIKNFIGEIYQRPHPYSAVKYKGKALHKYARAGERIVMPPRKVFIKSIDILGVEDNRGFLKVVNSKGVYIRSLAEDIAEKIGTYAYLDQLVRIRVGDFTKEKALTLDKLQKIADENLLKKHIISPVEALNMQKIIISNSDRKKVLQGVPIGNFISSEYLYEIENNKKFAIISENKNNLYAIVEKDEKGKIGYLRVFKNS